MPPSGYDALRRSVGKSPLSPVYYLHGDEELLKDEAVRMLLEAGLDPATRDFNCDRRRASELSADDFHSLVQTPPMMAARRAVVVTEAEWMQQRKPRAQALRTAVLAYAEHPSGETLLILTQQAGEKPDPALVRISRSVSVERLPPARVARWLVHAAGRLGLEMTPGAVAHLQDVIGDDLPALASELGKLAGAVTGRPASEEDVAALVGVRHGETVHDFVDAVTSRRGVEASGMIEPLLDSPGGTAVRLVAALGVSLLGVSLARSLLDEGMPPAAVVDRLDRAIREQHPLGLRVWRLEAERWARDAGRWSSGDLERALAELLRADRRLKNTAVAGGAEVLCETVLAICSPRGVAA